MTQTSPFLDEKMKKANGYCGMQIVFVDIVSYSRRKSYAQVDVIYSFMDSIEKALSQIAKKYVDFTQNIDVQIRRDVVVLPAGDGAVVAFPFEGVPEMHLDFAAELYRIIYQSNSNDKCETFQRQGWCNCHDTFLLRCGISEGKVILYKDLNGNFNLAGNTVNMAARVMDLADASQIFLTKDAYSQIADLIPGVETNFRTYQQVRIKHNLGIDVYQYVEGNLEGLDVSPRGGLEHGNEDIDQIDGTPSLDIAHDDTNDIYHVMLDNGESVTQGSKDFIAILRDQMIGIAAGEFLMGDPDGDHFLTEITRPLLISKYQITQDLYEEITGRNPSRFIGSRHPVDSVSWYDAVFFCIKLSELSGLKPAYHLSGEDVVIDYNANGFRLPTEAEWEYCSRGGGKDDRYGPVDEVAWYSKNSEGKTHEVGQKTANGFGLYDMLGNVWEWCNDWHQRSYPKERQRDYTGPQDGFERILRGGSWSDLPLCVSSVFRHRNNAHSSENIYGFRVVLTLFD